MDTSTLQAFVETAQLGSFSQASQRLFITQSAVSKRVAQLEDQIGARLFDRIGRTIALTDAGQALLPQARRILAELEDAKRVVENIKGEVSGRLSVAASHHISLHRLPNTLRTFTIQYPDVELDLRFYESEVAYEAVVHGDIELALITLSPESDPRLYSEVLWLDRLFYCVSNDHPIAKNGSTDFETLNQYPGILPAPNTFTSLIVHEQLSQRGLTPNLGISTNYLDTIRMMVSVGLGWSLLPESMIDNHLHKVVIDSDAIERPLGFIYHRDRTLSNAAGKLLHLLKEDAQKGS